MKRLSVFTFSIILIAIIVFGCKKEVLTSQEFVQRQIVGTWPLKYSIKTVYTNNIPAKADTLNKNLPIDTLIFSADGIVIKRNKVVISTTSYQIDAAGESITFGTPAKTQKIIYVRPLSIGLKTETTLGDVRTIIEDQLIKLN